MDRRSSLGRWLVTFLLATKVVSGQAFINTSAVEPLKTDECPSWLGNITKQAENITHNSGCTPLGFELLFCKDSVSITIGNGCLCTSDLECESLFCDYRQEETESVGICSQRKQDYEACTIDNECLSGDCLLGNWCTSMERPTAAPVVSTNVSDEENAIEDTGAAFVALISFFVVAWLMCVMLILFIAKPEDEGAGASSNTNPNNCFFDCWYCDCGDGECCECGDCECGGCDCGDCSCLCGCPCPV